MRYTMDDIIVTVKDGMICVSMAEEIEENIKNLLNHNYGMTIEQAINSFLIWCSEDPEGFKAWSENC